MARRYTRDNRGRFASVGATARGGRLKTAGGGRRATVTRQINAKPSSTIGRPKGYTRPAAKVNQRAKASAGPRPRFEKVKQAPGRRVADIGSGRRITISNTGRDFTATLVGKDGAPRMQRRGMRNVTAAKAWGANPNARGPRLMGGGLNTEASPRATWVRGSRRTDSTIRKPRGYMRPVAKTTPAKTTNSSNAPKRISYRLAYHGTSKEAAESIRKGGYQETKHGTYGPGVYATTSRKAAREYAAFRSAGGKDRFGEPFQASAKGPAVLVHRVPKSRINNKPLPGYLQRDWVSSMGNARRVDKQTTGHSPYLVMGSGLADRSLVRNSGRIRRRRKP